jgi:transposase
MYANVLDVFSMVSRTDVSYKTIERLYSNEEVVMALHNLLVLLLNKKGVERSDASGEGTGYSLTISKHQESVAQELKEKAKDEDSATAQQQPASTADAKDGPKKRAFVYVFRLMDLSTKMCIACGSSMKSEREAFDRAMKMLSTLDVTLDTARLDRYYSSSACVDSLSGGKVFVIPKSNATVKGSWKWKETMKEFVTNTIRYLGQYYRRESSESGFAADKKMLGWSIAQEREDRIECAQFCTGLWHNLFNLATL